MAEETAHTATTEVPKKEGGFPPFDTTTFPSQLFWLALTFGLMFVVLWRVAGPRSPRTIFVFQRRLPEFTRATITSGVAGRFTKSLPKASGR